MENLIEKAKKEYFELLTKIEEINKRPNRPILKELPKLLDIKVTQFDQECDLFDGMYGSILVTVWHKTDDIYSIGNSIEIFDENNNYIRDLTNEEMLFLKENISEEYKKGYEQALKDINMPRKMITKAWNPSECPRCRKRFYDYETCNDGYYKRAINLTRCPYCGQKIEWQ